MKKKKINLDVILAYRIKGFAFRSYPCEGYADALAYRDAKKQALEADFKNLSEEDFREKYKHCIY
jgi:hypothetical protein